MGGCGINAGAGEKKTMGREMDILIGVDSGDLVFPRCRNVYGADQGRLKLDSTGYKRSINNDESGFAEV